MTPTLWRDTLAQFSVLKNCVQLGTEVMLKRMRVEYTSGLQGRWPIRIIESAYTMDPVTLSKTNEFTNLKLPMFRGVTEVIYVPVIEQLLESI